MKCKLLVEELSEDFLISVMAGGLMCSDYIQVVRDENYKTTYEKYKEPNSTIEEIWVKMLTNGEKLVVIDIEDDLNTYMEITLEKLKNGLSEMFNKYPISVGHLLDIENGDPDFFDYDRLLQITLFGEVVYI